MFIEKGVHAAGLEEFHTALEKAWCRESCSEARKASWPGDHPAKGQCFVTALAVQARFGGEVYELPLPGGAIHFYNKVDGGIVDLSSEQFCEKVDADFYRSGYRSDPAVRLTEPMKREHYEALCQRLWK